jgi:transposase
VAQCGNLLEPLYDRMVQQVKNQGYLQADETTLKVLDRNKSTSAKATGGTRKRETHLGYLWGYHAVLSKMCVFDYQKGRGMDAPRQILTDYRGALQTDGYKVYRQYCLNPEVTHLAC